MKLKKNQLFFLFICGIVILSNTALCKNKQTKENIHAFKIEYVKEINNSIINNKEKGIGTIIHDFIFGEEITELNNPFNLILINSNSFWILDQGKSTILNYKVDQNELTDPIKNIYPSLVGICFDQDRNVYFSDSKNNKIYIKKVKSEKVDVYNKRFDLNKPTGIAYLSSAKQLWVCETGNHRIAQLESNGKILKTLGKRGTGRGEFNFPTFLWIDENELIYIVDSMNFRIQIIDGTGKVVKVFGEVGNATGFFARMKGIATDSKGHIYVVDGLYNTVQIFDFDGNFLFSFGAQGHGQGEFWLPAGIFIDDKDYIYIADSYNSRIQIFKLIEKASYEN